VQKSVLTRGAVAQVDASTNEAVTTPSASIEERPSRTGPHGRTEADQYIVATMNPE
jgi:hypothetical protein